MKEFRSFNTEITGFPPYDFQIKVAQLLLEGKNVILSVPTGAGKTWASVMPFLFALENPEMDFPTKMIYSLPLRTLANSIHEDVNKIINASIQTGEFNDDKYFESDIVFSTIDQTLSNFLCFPLPLSPRQANINAGALIGSYLVFDEFHLLDPNLSMSTTIGMLKMLENLSRYCIMTATLSNDFMEELKCSLGNVEIIRLDDFPEDKAKIGSLTPLMDKKKLFFSEQTLHADNVLKKHQKKTIVICNRVESAQKLYNDIVAQLDTEEKIKVVCLHARFFEKDRKEKEVILKDYFGKNANDQSIILISTQVIEAGMDISCEILHTEISPINSFLQRAGRCARFAGQVGEIYVYDVLEVEEKEKISLEPENDNDKSEIKKLNNKYLPYSPDLCKATITELKNYQNLDGTIPQVLVEKVLGNAENEIIQGLRSGRFNQDAIKSSWETCTKNNYRNTIRDIQNSSK